MKLCAIYCVWDDWDWFDLSSYRLCENNLVDGFILIYSIKSNYGDICDDYSYKFNYPEMNEHAFLFDPDNSLSPMQNETRKRNYGLDKARELGYTHFIMMDADEFYDPIEFRKAKDYMNSKPNLNGLVCKSQVYVKEPTLTIGLDTTLVPFIHKITPDLKHEFNRKYPFAWEGNKIRIDPTRSLNINSGVEMVDVTMHHMSYIRTDIRRKIRNSTARNNLEKSTILEDYKNAKPGYFFKFYGKELYQVENKFNIPPMIDLSV